MTENNNECSICLTELKNSTEPFINLECQHRFHQPCLLQWIHTQYIESQLNTFSCPNCRTIHDNSQYVGLYGGSFVDSMIDPLKILFDSRAIKIIVSLIFLSILNLIFYFMAMIPDGNDQDDENIKNSKCMKKILTDFKIWYFIYYIFIIFMIRTLFKYYQETSIKKFVNTLAGINIGIFINCTSMILYYHTHPCTLFWQTYNINYPLIYFILVSITCSCSSFWLSRLRQNN